MIPLKKIKLFFSLERYAFLILIIEIICGVLCYIVTIYHPVILKIQLNIVYTIIYIPAAIYFLIKMIKLFMEWPHKYRYHIITVNHYKYMTDAGLPIQLSKLYKMNSACEKITRDEVCKENKIKL